VRLRRTERSLRHGVQTLAAEGVAGSPVVVSARGRPVPGGGPHPPALGGADAGSVSSDGVGVTNAVDQVYRSDGYALRGQPHG
jgi:hypothetical protein